MRSFRERRERLAATEETADSHDAADTPTRAPEPTRRTGRDTVRWTVRHSRRRDILGRDPSTPSREGNRAPGSSAVADRPAPEDANGQRPAGTDATTDQLSGADAITDQLSGADATTDQLSGTDAAAGRGPDPTDDSRPPFLRLATTDPSTAAMLCHVSLTASRRELIAEHLLDATARHRRHVVELLRETYPVAHVCERYADERTAVLESLGNVTAMEAWLVIVRRPSAEQARTILAGLSELGSQARNAVLELPTEQAAALLGRNYPVERICGHFQDPHSLLRSVLNVDPVHAWSILLQSPDPTHARRLLEALPAIDPAWRETIATLPPAWTARHLGPETAPELNRVLDAKTAEGETPFVGLADALEGHHPSDEPGRFGRVHSRVGRFPSLAARDGPDAELLNQSVQWAEQYGYRQEDLETLDPAQVTADRAFVERALAAGLSVGELRPLLSFEDEESREGWLELRTQAAEMGVEGRLKPILGKHPDARLIGPDGSLSSDEERFKTDSGCPVGVVLPYEQATRLGVWSGSAAETGVPGERSDADVRLQVGGAELYTSARISTVSGILIGEPVLRYLSAATGPTSGTGFEVSNRQSTAFEDPIEPGAMLQPLPPQRRAVATDLKGETATNALLTVAKGRNDASVTPVAEIGRRMTVESPDTGRSIEVEGIADTGNDAQTLLSRSTADRLGIHWSRLRWNGRAIGRTNGGRIEYRTPPSRQSTTVSVRGVSTATGPVSSLPPGTEKPVVSLRVTIGDVTRTVAAVFDETALEFCVSYGSLVNDFGMLVGPSDDFLLT